MITDLEKNGFDITMTGFEASEVDELFNNFYAKEATEDNFDEEAAHKDIDCYEINTKVAVKQKNGIMKAFFEKGIICADKLTAIVELNAESDEVAVPKFAEVRMRERDEQTRQPCVIAEEKGKADYCKQFDADNRALEARISGLEYENGNLIKENHNLKSKCESLTSAFDQDVTDDRRLISVSELSEFFDGEQYDLIVSALQLYNRNAEPKTRASELSDALLAKKPLKGDGEKLFSELLRLFTNSPEVNKSCESGLRELGFTMDRGKAGHNQLVYQNNSNYKFTATCSPGDRNAGSSRMKEIRRRLSIYKG
jgi:hypothetical protein